MAVSPKTQFVADLSPKDSVDSIFFVKYIAVMQAKDGKSYLNVVLCDNSGDLEARSWQNAEQISSEIKKGDFVTAKGKVNFYQGRKQLIISDIGLVEEQYVDQTDFIVKAARGADEMFSELLNIVHEKLDDVYIKELLTNILSDKEISRRIKLWQAGKSIHHAYQSGLLEHILSCTNLSLILSAHYKVNHNYVVAGSILHDLCKVYELTDGLSVEYTEEGKLVGHLVKGVELVDRFSYKIKNFPYDLKLHLKHILLAHHGEYAYGSPKIPQTSEAYLVHLIDFMDSKMHTFETIKRTDNNEGNWSNYIKHLDRIVYKRELPYYPEYLPDNYKETANPSPKKKPGFKPPKDPTNKMGGLLKDFKVDS